MAYGITIYNSAGKLIANSDDFNYGLLAEGTLTFSSGGMTSISWTDTGEVPLVFFKFNNFNGSITHYLGFYGLSTTGVQAGMWNPTPVNGRISRMSGSADYRVYKTFKSLSDSPDGSTYGMQIFNSSGEKTFDSRYRMPLVVAAANLGPVPTPSSYLLPSSYVTVPAAITGANLWASINPLSGVKGFQQDLVSNPALCFGGLGVANGYLINVFCHQPAGGPSNQSSWDSSKTLYLMNA